MTNSSKAIRLLKIGYDAKRLFNNFTGLGNYSRTLVRNMQECFPEHEYHLFTTDIEKNDETSYFLNREKFHVHCCTGMSKSFWRTYSITHLANELNLDIYHGLSHELPLNITKFKGKSMVTFHDLIYEKYPQQFGLWDRKSYSYKYRRSAVNSDRVICISENTRKDLVKLYDIDNEKCDVVYQSCYPIFFNQNQRLNFSGDRHYFLYVGSIIERKGLLTIVEAINSMQESDRPNVIVVGEGKEYKQKVLNAIGKYNLQSYFDFRGSIPNDFLMKLYRDAVALVFPSEYEGFGIPIIESLLCGTPVITSNVSSLPEAAGPGSLLISPHSATELAQVMMSIDQDHDLRELKAREGRDYVVKNFRGRMLSRQLHGIYQTSL